jgi:PsbP
MLLMALFTVVLLLFILVSISGQFAFAQSNSSSLTNDSNRVLANIVSNLASNNPDRVVGGFHDPSFNTSKSKPDIPAAGEKGFSVAQEKDFTIFYPSSWIKNTPPTGQFTGLYSTPIVTFSSADNNSIRNSDGSSSNSIIAVAKTDLIGNKSSHLSLFDYVKEEINALESNVSFQLNESSPTKIGGNNSTYKIVYTTSKVDSNTPAKGQEKTLEIITTKNGAAYFLAYSANVDDYHTYLPIINKMIDSFKFK